MKKTRIIVPGMAVIAFSTAAAIAGSVAWFTASRTVTISAGSYAVVKTTSNLEAKLFDGVGTSVRLVDGNYAVDFEGRLTDASFNHLSGSIFKPNGNGTAIDGEGTVALGSYDTTDEDSIAALATALDRGTITINSTDVNVYSAATFDIEFSMNFGSGWETAKQVGLYLDNTASKSSFTVSGGAAAVTATGFRMAFYSTNTAARSTVFADLQTDVQDADGDPETVGDVHVCKYVSSATNFAGTEYGADGAYDLIDATWDEALPTSSTTRAEAEARPDLLAIFTPAQDAVKIRFTVVCWFEGTDPNVVDQDVLANYQTVISNLVFEAIDLNPAANSTP